MPYETYCVIVPRAVYIDQIQASYKNYSECLYITDLVSVISILITLEITTTGHSKNSLPINTQIRPPANQLFQFFEVHDAS